MKKVNILLLSALALLATSGQAADRVGDFSLLDQDGNFHSMSWYNDHQAIVLLVQGNGSDATKAALPGFMQLKATYEEQGIEFMLINPTGSQDRDSIKSDLAALGVDIPVLVANYIIQQARQ